MELEQVVSPTQVEGQPVDGAVVEGGQTPTAPVTEQPTQPVKETPEASAKTESTVDAQAAWENQWLRQTVTQMAEQLRQSQAEMQQYVMAGMDDAEKQAYLLQQKEQQLTTEQRTWQETVEREQWSRYYTQYLPTGVQLQGATPVEWQHGVLTHLYNSNETLRKEVEALKAKLTNPNPNPPKISALTPAPVARKQAEQFTLKDIQRIQEQALLGAVDANDFPSILS